LLISGYYEKTAAPIQSARWSRQKLHSDDTLFSISSDDASMIAPTRKIRRGPILSTNRPTTGEKQAMAITNEKEPVVSSPRPQPNSSEIGLLRMLKPYQMSPELRERVIKPAKIILFYAHFTSRGSLRSRN